MMEGLVLPRGLPLKDMKADSQEVSTVMIAGTCSSKEEDQEAVLRDHVWYLTLLGL